MKNFWETILEMSVILLGIFCLYLIMCEMDLENKAEKTRVENVKPK